MSNKFKTYTEYKFGDFLLRSQVLLLKVKQVESQLIFTFLNLNGKIVKGIANIDRGEKFEVVENV
jgi:hypothetical protein